MRHPLWCPQCRIKEWNILMTTISMSLPMVKLVLETETIFFIQVYLPTTRYNLDVGRNIPTVSLSHGRNSSRCRSVSSKWIFFYFFVHRPISLKIKCRFNYTNIPDCIKTISAYIFPEIATKSNTIRFNTFPVYISRLYFS